MCVCAIELNYDTYSYLRIYVHIYYVYIRMCRKYQYAYVHMCIHAYLVLLCLRTYVCTSSDNDPSSVIVCCTILLGILTCGTSVLFWCLYKKCCGRKENYNVEGAFVCTYIPISTCTSSYTYVCHLILKAGPVTCIYVATMHSCVCMYVLSLAYIHK